MMGIQHATEEYTHAEYKPSSPKPTSSHENKTAHIPSSRNNNSKGPALPAVTNEAKHGNSQD